jgi:hypothetical protein
MPKATNYHVEKTEIQGVKVSIATYQIGDKFLCHIENENPGATIARAEGTSQEEAKQLAIAKVTKRVQ